jgi:ATP-dependent Clp protease protease subunit
MGRPTTADRTSLTLNNTDDEAGSWPQLHVNDRVLYLAGAVTEQMVLQVIAGLIALANHDKTLPITLVISTYGGSVDEMFSLYDIINYLPCPVHTVGTGKIMSAGVLLLASGKKGARLIGRNARLMIHPTRGGSEGNVFEVVNDTTEHVRQQAQMEKLLMKETKIGKAKLDALMKSGYDNYILADEAVKMGIVDRVIGADP